jgi:DMSO/TMAO reductase YedYZ heme-binding membrane subunit
MPTPGRRNLQGEVATSVGVLALVCLLGPAVATLSMLPKPLGGVRWKRNQRLG